MWSNLPAGFVCCLRMVLLAVHGVPCRTRGNAETRGCGMAMVSLRTRECRVPTSTWHSLPPLVRARHFPRGENAPVQADLLAMGNVFALLGDRYVLPPSMYYQSVMEAKLRELPLRMEAGRLSSERSLPWWLLRTPCCSRLTKLSSAEVFQSKWIAQAPSPRPMRSPFASTSLNQSLADERDQQ